MFKNFIFGDIVTLNNSLSADEMKKLIERAKEIKITSTPPSQEGILAVFGRIAKKWQDPAYAIRKEAFGILIKNTGLSKELVEMVLEELPKLFTPEHIMKKIEGELGNPAIQNEPIFQQSTGAHLMAQPAGLVLHVASGNVFLACVESLIDGIITKNVNFVKMSTAEREFPIIFARSIKECDPEGLITKRLAILWWEAGNDLIESAFKASMDRIVFWGGYDALLNWKKGLGEATALIQHGPKVSFGIVSKEGLERSDLKSLTGKIAFDVSIWEQRACNCPQMIFLESAISQEKINAFIDSLTESFKRINSEMPPASRSDDEYVEILRRRELAMAKLCTTDEKIEVVGSNMLDWTIIYDEDQKNKEFELSPLGRTIIIRRYKSLDALSEVIKAHAFYLQTVGYCLSDDEIMKYAKVLSANGVSRLCPFGVMAIPMPGAPHDGAYALRDLTRFTVIES